MLHRPRGGRAGKECHTEAGFRWSRHHEKNNQRIKVAGRRRERPKLPAYVELTQVRGDVSTTLYEGLESQTVADALLECRGRIESERLLAAARQARAEGLLTTAEWQRVTKGLRR